MLLLLLSHCLKTQHPLPWLKFHSSFVCQHTFLLHYLLHSNKFSSKSLFFSHTRNPAPRYKFFHLTILFWQSQPLFNFFLLEFQFHAVSIYHILLAIFCKSISFYAKINWLYANTVLDTCKLLCDLIPLRLVFFHMLKISKII